MAMTLQGLVAEFSANQVVDWEIATSGHVHTFWDDLPFSPFFVGRVVTRLISQERVPAMLPESGANLTEPIPPVSILPVLIRYEQEISYGLLDETEPPLPPVEEALFLEPFRQNSLPYVREIIRFTNNQGPIFLSNIEILTEPPSPAPTPIPAGDGKNERRIILTVSLCVGFSIMIAIAYIVYLTCKENLDGPIIGPMPSKDYNEEDDNFYLSASIHSPSSTQVVANIDMANSFESDMSPSARSTYSDVRAEERLGDSNSDTGIHRERSGSFTPTRPRSASFPSSPPTSPDNPLVSASNVMVRDPSSGSLTTFGDGADATAAQSDGDGDSGIPAVPSMEAFNLQIQDIED